MSRAAAANILTSRISVGGRELSEETLLRAVYDVLCIDAGFRPGLHPKLAFKLHEADLLKKASIAHVEDRTYPIDFAWPAKRIGLRVVHGSPDCHVDSRVADHELRERGWLMLAIDPRSTTFEEQFARVVAVIKRMGPYSGVLR
jgi:hypothetical protein